MVQRNRRFHAGLAKWPVVSPSTAALSTAGLSTALLAAVAVLAGGCSIGDSTLHSIGMPPAETSVVRAEGMMGASRAGGHDAHLTVTPRQQSYLDALIAAGVRPSEDLMALSIGAYICQARAAKQSEQAVWDFVLPLVRNDLSDTHVSSVAPEVGDVNTATADYIRIATERLC